MINKKIKQMQEELINIKENEFTDLIKKIDNSKKELENLNYEKEKINAEKNEIAQSILSKKGELSNLKQEISTTLIENEKILKVKSVDKLIFEKNLQIESLDLKISGIKLVAEHKDLFDLVYSLVKTNGAKYVKDKLYDIEKTYDDLTYSAKKAMSIMNEYSQTWTTPAKLAEALAPLIKGSIQVNNSDNSLSREISIINGKLEHIISHFAYNKPKGW